MKGDFTRFTHDPKKRYTRVLKQMGRVDLDADWNEFGDILAHLERTEAIDVIGRCGVPKDTDGFRVDRDGESLTFTPGRIYVDGILGEHVADGPIPLESQPDLPGYEPPEADGLYVVYADLWERHITALEDPDIREVALGGPDTATRLKTICQVKLARIAEDGDEDPPECRPFPGPFSTGKLRARSEPVTSEENPCVVPAAAGYRGLENRLYRVEIHDDGLDEAGNEVRTPTFKWSRDNGAVVLPVAEDGIDGDEVTLQRFGPDETLTVKSGHWVEVLGDETELHGRHGTMAQIEPDGIDEAQRRLTLSADVSLHSVESHLKVRRWDQDDRADAPLVDGAVPINSGVDYELEDGVLIHFDPGGTYRVGDYWLIPARTREGDVLWPREGDPAVAVALEALGIRHHTCTLAMVRRFEGAWSEPNDCRPQFPPLTDLPQGGCCIDVEPGEDLRQAIQQAVAAGGGKICLCSGVHNLNGPLVLQGVENLTICGQSSSTVLQMRGTDEDGRGGIVVESSRRLAFCGLVMVGFDTPSIVSVSSAHETQQPDDSHTVSLRDLALLNAGRNEKDEGRWRAALELADTRDILVENCRLMAEVGILSRFGGRLPEVPRPEVSENGQVEVTIDFGDQTVGQTFDVNGNFTSRAAQVAVRPITLVNGETRAGSVSVEDGGGGDRSVRCRDATLAFDFVRDFDAPARNLTLEIRNQVQNQFNLEVNGELEVFTSFEQIDQKTVGGVLVRVDDTQPNTSRRALALDGDVRTLAFGARTVRIDEVRFVAGEQPSLPERTDLDYGRGVSDVHIHGCRIRYGDYGILSLKSDGWHLQDCELEQDDLTLLQGDLKPSDRAALQVVLNQFSRPAGRVDQKRGTAIFGFFWLNSRIVDSRLVGARGLEMWLCLDSEVSNCRIEATLFGLASLWLSKSSWSHNRIDCRRGPALTFVGTHRSTLRSNRIEARIGLFKLPFEEVARSLPDHLTAIVRGYQATAGSEERRRALWMLLEEWARQTSLAGLVRNVQDVVDRYYEAQASGARVLFPDPPKPILYLLAGLLLESIGRSLEEPAKAPFWISLGTLLPIMQLRVEDNRMKSVEDTILMERFLTLFGVRVEGNRLCTARGQTIRINAWPYSANPALVSAAILLVADFLAGRLTEIKVPEFGATFDGLRLAVKRLLDRVASGLTALAKRMRACRGDDYRIGGNTLESVNTAIESNLFELAITDNHISLSERPIKNTAIEDLIERLKANPSHRDLGFAVGSGNAEAVEYDALSALRKENAASTLFLDYNPADWRANRELGVWADLGNRVNNNLDSFGDAVAGRRFDEALRSYNETALLMLETLNSFGIWAKGAGCRIEGNHVLVPADLDPDTFAQGGIRLQGDERVNQVILVLQRITARFPALDPLLGVTETLIAGNEVIGGVGHGIHILSVAGKSPSEGGTESNRGLPQALFGLKVRDNQIRDMSGAGLVIDRETLAIDLDIENNLISECGNRKEGVDFTRLKGGMFIDLAALVRIRCNRVERCGLVDVDEESGFQKSGLRLEDLLGLSLADNSIVGNGVLGARLSVSGAVEICDNVLSYNDYRGLEIVRSEAHEQLLALLSLYLSKTIADLERATPPQILLADNLFRGQREYQFGLYLDDDRVTVKGNSSRGGGYADRVYTSGGFLVVTDNVFDPDSESREPLYISGGAKLILVGNMSTNERPITISGIANIQKGFNQPPVP